MNVRQALKHGTSELRAAGVSLPHLDSAVLLASALSWTKERLFTEAGQDVPPDRLFVFCDMIARRAKKEPVQYITGRREFMCLDFLVRQGVLVPRPETEILVEKAIDLSRQQSLDNKAVHSEYVIADIGTGSGAIAVCLSLGLRDTFKKLGRRFRVLATDISADALSLARENATRFGAEVELLQGDCWEPFQAAGMSLDAVVSNPPYIASWQLPEIPDEVRLYEPATALDGGPDGLDFYRRLISGAAGLLKPGGFMALEVGAGQASRVLSLMEQENFVQCGMAPDLAGIERVVWGHYHTR